jgi:hypothetical protein
MPHPAAKNLSCLDLCAFSERTAAFGHIRPREPFPATPRGVAAQAAVSVLTRQKTLPVYDDSGLPGHQHR